MPAPEPTTMGGQLTASVGQTPEATAPLPEDLQAALKTLLDTFEQEDSTSRREEVRRIRKHREFWKGNQYLFWSERDQNWKQPSSEPQEDDPAYQYVTNIFRASGETFIAAVSQNPPVVKFWPQSPKQAADVMTAKAADDICDFIQRNNRMESLLQDEAFYLWTDGSTFSYVRYVVDGERFGYDTVPIMEEQWTDLGDGTLAPVPVEVGSRQVPKGQEVIEYFGRLEVRVPSYAKTQRDYAYLEWNTEIHKAKLCETYPDAAEKIKTSGSIEADDSYERNARLGLTAANSGGLIGNTEATNLVTFKRVWFRPWVFDSLESSKRDQLKALFPQGCYVAFAGDVYCESRNESMDKCWRVCHALPGDGQTRDAVGKDLISIQERYNTLSNIQIETYEHTIPTTFFDSEAIDADAWGRSGNRPGVYWPVRARPGAAVGQQFYTTQSGNISPQLAELASELMGPVAQWITGLLPALFGGQSSNDTASGYAMQRDQAMGRIGLIYRRVKEFHAETMLLAVEAFRANRSGEVEMGVLGPAGQFDQKTINLDELRGSIFAHPETAEDFPVSWSSRRNTYLDLVNTQNPALQPLFATPANMSELGKTLGMKGLVLPGEQARAQQYREIAELLDGQPMQAPPQMDPFTGLPMTADPMTGMPVEPQYATTVPVDELLDNHEVHIATIQEWAESDEGQLAKAQNPAGFMNVRLHAQQHEAVLSMRMQQMALAQQAVQPQPSGGGERASEPEPPPPPIQ